MLRKSVFSFLVVFFLSFFFVNFALASTRLNIPITSDGVIGLGDNALPPISSGNYTHVGCGGNGSDNRTGVGWWTNLDTGYACTSFLQAQTSDGNYYFYWDTTGIFSFTGVGPNSNAEYYAKFTRSGGVWSDYTAPPSCVDDIQNQNETSVDAGGICENNTYSSLNDDTSEQISSSFNYLTQTLGTNLTGTLTKIDIRSSNASAIYYGSRPWIHLYECDNDTYGNFLESNSPCTLLYSNLSTNTSQLDISTQSFYPNSIIFNPLKYYFFKTQGNNIFNVLPVFYGSTQDTVEGSCYQHVSPSTRYPCKTISDLYFKIYGVSKSSPPPPDTCTVDCFSNVLFLPGLMGSRLYEQDGSLDNELWVSRDDSSHADLLLDSQGKSIHNTIHTKNDTQNNGELDEGGVVDDVYSVNIYQSFIKDLKKWKEDEKIITDYAFVPYDWRLSLDDIITNGAVSSENDLSYTRAQDFSESFILKKLESLQSNSKSGKVTIIAHSNGGLVAKALIQKLKDTNNSLYDKIDKVILIAVPQIGTPDAVLNLLHGTELGFGFIMGKPRSRNLAENMPAIYNLLPSNSYFTMSQIPFAPEKLISFEETSIFNPQKSQYGPVISDQKELKDYILGGDGRTKPAFNDTIHPNIGNSTLYSQAENVHEILDSWQPSSNTKVIQVAGWGEETISGLGYKSYAGGTLDTVEVSYKPHFVVDGDGTVVVPSALWMSTTNPNVERWWVDLKSYNNQRFFSTKHRDILEISNLLIFIKSKIKNTSPIDPENIIVDNTSTLISDDTRLHFTLHSPLTLGIVDGEGKYTGMDPTTKGIKEEIPDVTYKQIGEVQFLSAPYGNTYTLKLQGYAEGFFSLDVEKQIGNTITDSTLFEGIPSSTSTLATIDITSSFEVSNSKLGLDSNGDGNVDQTYPMVNVEPITPSVEISTTPNGSASSSSGGGNLPLPVLSVEQPNNEIENNIQIIPQTEEIQETKNESVNLNTTEKQEKVDEVEIPEEVVKVEDAQLSATVINSSFGDNWILYVIILTILILVFLVRRFVKI